MPTDIKTDSALLARLKQAASHPLTRAELHQQRVSFIYGNLPTHSSITRPQVEAALARSEGDAEAA